MVVAIGVAVASVIAFREVLIAPLGWLRPEEFEYWFFIPARDSGLLALAIAAWLLWSRRAALREARASTVGPGPGIAAAVVLLAFAAVQASNAPTLLIPVFCAFVATLAAAWAGRKGLRLVALPCLALLLTFPPPNPLLAEILWRLQQLTAAGSEALLSLGGVAIEREGTELRLGGNLFLVIEACSGWRGIQILALVAVIAAELRGIALPRALWLIVAAVPLGIGLNLARASLIVLTTDELSPELFASHTPQGIVVLLVGGLALYGLAVWLEPPPDGTADGGDASEEGAAGPSASGAARAVAQGPPTRFAGLSVGLALALALASIAAPRLREPFRPPPREPVVFPTDVIGWTSEPLEVDFFFPYESGAHPQFHVEYRRGRSARDAELVDLFIARERPQPSGANRIPATKLALPTSDWQIESVESARLWDLGFDAKRAFLSRNARSEFAHVVFWRHDDQGLLRESLKSLFGFDACDLSRERCGRTVIRIAVPVLRDDDRARQRARETADRFLRDYGPAFAVLARG